MQTDYLKNLVSFVQAAQLGSFTAAANKLEITAAAVSKNISTLEKTLGVRLFNRTTRSISLTAEGLGFFEQSKTALDSLDQAVKNVSQSTEHPVGSVRISVSNTIGRNLILPFLPELMERYPQIELEVNFEDRVIDFVQAGYDLVIRGGILGESSMISRKISDLRTCLVASPDYIAKYGTPKNEMELSQHRQIALRFLNGKYSTWQFNQDGVSHPFTFSNKVLTLTDTEAVTQLALAGQGIAKVPMYLAWEHLQAGRLKLVLEDSFDSGNFELALQYPHRTLVTPRVRVVIDYLLEKLAEIEGLHIGEKELKKL